MAKKDEEKQQEQEQQGQPSSPPAEERQAAQDPAAPDENKDTDAGAREKSEEQKARDEAARVQAEARNKEAVGGREPGVDAKATVPVNADAPANVALREEQDRGFIGGQPFEDRFADEERQRRIRAGLMPE